MDAESVHTANHAAHKFLLVSLHGALQAAQLIIDEAVTRGGADDKTCTVIYFKWRKDLFPQKQVTEEADVPDAAASLQRQHPRRDYMQEMQLQADSSESPETPRETAEEQQVAVSAESDTHGAAADKGQEASTGDGSRNGRRKGELHASAPAEDHELANTKDDAGAARSAVQIAPVAEPEEPSGPPDPAREEGGRRVRSSGLEEIAAITSSLDVEALIRKRKREQQMEAEEAAAAAAAAAEAAEVSIP